jgi:hypothetical protein
MKRNLEETFISRHIIHQHLYICPIALPVPRNPQNIRLLAVFSATSGSPFQPLSHQRNVCHSVVNRFTLQTRSSVNRKHFFMYILFIESICPQERHNRTLVFGSIRLKHLPNFGYWNQPRNMRMRVCYVDWHEVELCCYLVIHMENLLRPLQLFYFHLWPIYWISPVVKLITIRLLTLAVVISSSAYCQHHMLGCTVTVRIVTGIISVLLQSQC